MTHVVTETFTTYNTATSVIEMFAVATRSLAAG